MMNQGLNSGVASDESPFGFIASRLRAIPLVSAGMSRAELESIRSQKEVSMSSLGRPRESNSTAKSIEGPRSDERVPTRSMSSSPVRREQQHAKRDASSFSSEQKNLGDRIQNQSEVLFRPNGITVSTANIMRKPTTSTTTRRPRTTTTRRKQIIISSAKPKQKPKTTSTRKPQSSIVPRQRRIDGTTTTTTTKKPESVSKLNISQNENGSKQSKFMSVIEPITSYRASTLKAFAQSEDSSQMMDPNNEPQPTTTIMPNSAISDRLGKQLQQYSSNVQTASPIQLSKATKAQQLMSTQPVNQRRQQLPLLNLGPSLSSSSSTTSANRYGPTANRFSSSRNSHENDPLRGAGEQWTLFNKPDGSLSVFEMVVLLSNILIVSTVIFVILFQFIKSIRKKRARAMTTQQQLAEQSRAESAASSQQQSSILMMNTNATAPASTPTPTPNPNPNPNPNNNNNNNKLSSGDAMSQSRISMISSGLQSQVSGPTVTTATSQSQANISSNELATKSLLNEEQQANAIEAPSAKATSQQEKDQENLVKKLDSTLQSMSANASSVISSEIKSQATNQVANKAMAIVQPSAESGHHQAQVGEEKDKEKENEKDSPKTESWEKDDLKRDLLKLQQDSQRQLKSDDQQIKALISRSVSDLSGETTAAAVAKDDPMTTRRAADDSTPVSDQDRVHMLEELFTSGGKGEKPKKLSQINGKQPKQNTNSLESIELPENLIVKAESSSKQPMADKVAAVTSTILPSPNLLLGQTAGTQAGPTKAGSSSTGTAVANDKVVEKKQQENASRSKDSSTTKQVKNGGDESKKTSKSEARPENPMGRDDKISADSSGAETKSEALIQRPQYQKAEVKNHQVVVNTLDKRKTNLEIVDLRDASVTGKMRSKYASLAGSNGQSGQKSADPKQMDGWISMDGVAVVQALPPTKVMAAPTGNSSAGDLASQLSHNQNPQAAAVAMSPSEIIESKFHVDYASGSAKSRRSALVGSSDTPAQNTASPSNKGKTASNQDSLDSKQDEYVFNNIENELEMDNKMRNRKYFVYIVHDGHFTAKKECIARIELPSKRRITLAELRQLISSSQDISLSSLRRNRFKFVTETYRLLNENEDAAVLHQVYPTQGVFLKLNVTDNQDSNQTYPYKGSSRLHGPGSNHRLSSGAGGLGSQAGSGMSGGPSGNSLSQATISSRRRANVRSGGRKLNTTSGRDGNMLPAIEVEQYNPSGQALSRSRAALPAARASSVGRAAKTPANSMAQYGRSKSSVHMGRRQGGQTRRGVGFYNGANTSDEKLPPIGRSSQRVTKKTDNNTKAYDSKPARDASGQASAIIGNAASDLGANMLSGAKKLFKSTFSKK